MLTPGKMEFGKIATEFRPGFTKFFHVQRASWQGIMIENFALDSRTQFKFDDGFPLSQVGSSTRKFITGYSSVRAHLWMFLLGPQEAVWFFAGRHQLSCSVHFRSSLKTLQFPCRSCSYPLSHNGGSLFEGTPMMRLSCLCPTLFLRVSASRVDDSTELSIPAESSRRDQCWERAA